MSYMYILLKRKNIRRLNSYIKQSKTKQTSYHNTQVLNCSKTLTTLYLLYVVELPKVHVTLTYLFILRITRFIRKAETTFVIAN